MQKYAKYVKIKTLHFLMELSIKRLFKGAE